MATALAVVVPVGYIAILAARPASTPSPARAPVGLGMAPVGPTIRLLDDPPIEARLLAPPGDPTPRAVEIAPSRDPAIPDLLAYWATAASDGSLPEGAVLLGALRGSRTQVLPLPAGASAATGRVVLYSQGWHRVMSTTPLTGP